MRNESARAPSTSPADDTGSSGVPIDALSLAEALAQRCQHARATGDGWEACCPAHEDTTPSLTITSTPDRVLIHCHAGCEPEAILHALGVTFADLFVHARGHPNGHKPVVHVYDYVDATRTLVHQTVRYAPKAFRQRRPDPAHPGMYLWNLTGIEPVLYRLPDVLMAVQRGEVVYLVEGEKDADTLQALGLVATCNPMGAGKWRPSYSEALRGAAVVILPDNDEPGKQRARHVAHALERMAVRLKIVPLPDLPEKGDVSDWLTAGKTRADVEAVV
jgi:putative DNA primase/helicase